MIVLLTSATEALFKLFKIRNYSLQKLNISISKTFITCIFIIYLLFIVFKECSLDTRKHFLKYNHASINSSRSEVSFHGA